MQQHVLAAGEALGLGIFEAREQSKIQQLFGPADGLFSRLSLAKGNITGTPAVLWSYNQDTPYVPSALLHRGALYFLKSNQGILTCIDIETGKPHYSNQRLEGINTVYASPVGVADRIYLTGREGTTVVIRHGAKFGLIATNTLDDKIDASPVIVGDELFLRGHQYLYCIAE